MASHDDVFPVHVVQHLRLGMAGRRRSHRPARHLGAELMYYSGTAIDVALAAIMMSQWYAATGRLIT